MKEGNTPYVAFVPNINLQVKKKIINKTTEEKKRIVVDYMVWR